MEHIASLYIITHLVFSRETSLECLTKYIVCGLGDRRKMIEEERYGEK